VKILLHACCGPCSIEPVSGLLSAGHDITIFFSNSNIHPETEYNLRLRTLLAWAQSRAIPVVEDTYDPTEWWECAGEAQKICTADPTHEQRCRICYRMRLQHAAKYARDHGFDALSTTLAVSPYQFTDVIRQELVQAAQQADVTPLFIDWRPLYPDSVRDSKAFGMYRQKYCGCAYSKAEAEAQRKEIEAERAAKNLEKAHSIQEAHSTPKMHSMPKTKELV